MERSDNIYMYIVTHRIKTTALAQHMSHISAQSAGTCGKDLPKEPDAL